MLAASVMVAVFAFGVLTAWGREQLPAWGQCVRTESGTGGRYADPGCIQPVKKVYGSYPGAYEWYPHEVSPELGTGEATLQDRIPAEEQPVSSMTITLANGDTITCQALSQSTEVEITGPHTTLGAPLLAFQGCQSAGSPCFTTDSGLPGQVTTKEEYENFYHGTGETWNGTLTYFEGRRASGPVVGYVWKTNPAKQRFFQELKCEAGPVLTMVIGGRRSGEELAMQVDPVNTMSASHTLTMRQSGGVGQPTSFEGRRAKPLEALVEAVRWEPVGFETTMLFPETEGVSSLAEPHGVVVRGELELKATP